ncbi:unnamed protein product [Adineta steineri]|uniref:Uncharacterized protein n=1 Tax=Adineta steineri TaxID=433720 RepID=A0A815GE19_9BILA|nr:unnamed protein product [Adineta steineri]
MEEELLQLEPRENTVEENNLEPTLSLTADQNNQEERQQEQEEINDDVPLLSNHSNQSVVIRKSCILTKNKVQISFIIILLLVIILLISIKIPNSSSRNQPQSSPITVYNTTTTTRTTELTQSPITTTETLTLPPKSCPIPSVNATWNKPGVVFINRLGRCLSNENSLCSPRDLFIDNVHDILYVVDTNNNRIQKYSLNEIYNMEVGATGITVASKDLVSPQSIFVDIHTEDMYILDFDQKQIRNPVNLVSYRVHLWKKNEKIGRILFREAGEHLFGHQQITQKKIIVAGKYQFSGNQSTDLSDPVGFVVTDDLTIYIADWQNKRIQQWKINGTEGTTVIGNLTYVFGLTIDCNGYLYYTEMYESTIYQLNMMTNQNQMIVRNEDHLQKLIYYWPTAITIDKFGNIFSMGHDQVYKFSIAQK